MIAFKFPTEEDLKEMAPHFQGDTVQILQEAVDETAKILLQDVHQRRVSRKLSLNKGKTNLPDFPVTDLEVINANPHLIALNEEAGILTSELDAGEYQVNYTVGYQDGYLPAVVQRVLFLTLREKVTGTPAEEDKFDAILVWSTKRERLKRERQLVTETDGKEQG